MATAVVPLLHTTSSSDAVTWSTDDRIALTCSDVIYVFTLKGPSFVSNTSSKQSTVPFNITTVDKITSTLSKGLKASARTNIPNAEMEDLSIFLDPSMNGIALPHDEFHVAKWSPSGCGPNGRCLLSCLTKCSRLLIYSPPSTMERKWHLLFDVSSYFIDLLTQVEYDIDKLNPCINRDEETDGVEPQVKRKLSKNLQEANEYYDKKSIEVITSFAWYPFCVYKSTGEKCMMCAMTVRRGYLILWCFESTDNFSSNIINIIKISDSSCNWPSTIQWNTSILGYTLTIGYTNGQVDCIHWEFVDSLRPDVFSMPRPLLTLWAEDGIAISHMTWSTVQVDEGDRSLKWRWFIFNKTQYIIILPVIMTSSSLSVLPYTFIDGIHTLPVTGLSLLNNNDVISCSVDGSMQKFSLPTLLDNHRTNSSHKCHMTDVFISASSVALFPAKFPLSCHGIASSMNSVFAVVGVNLVSYNKIKYQSQLQLIPLKSHDHMFHESLQQDRIKCSWDIYEYIRQNPDSWDGISGPGIPLSRTRRQIQYMMNKAMLVAEVTPSEDSAVSGELQLIIDHSRIVLEKFIDFYSTRKESLNSVSEISVTNLLSVILKSSSITENDRQLTSKVCELVPDSNLELCRICNKEVIFTNFKRDQCVEGHSWDRCVITLCLITEPHLGLVCSLCGAQSLTIHQDSRDNWLSWLLTDFIHCPLCDGYFESFG